jgi:serine/threonine protein kinase
MLSFSADLRADQAVGKYRVVSPLGQGGTADVYLAVADGPSGFRKLVVLKVLKKSLSDDPEFRAMFLSEAQLAARLCHPNIVQTNEVLELEGTPTMVMEYLEGQPLSQVIIRGREGGFTLAMQLRVLVDALNGLHAAHELADYDGTPLGVVHRDVSPHNLFVTFEGQAKVLDFGIAKLERSLVETEVGTIKGKLRYMAPEQLAGEKLDRRADVYAAGVILWEALVGERMWKGCSEQEIRSRVQAGDLPTPQGVRPEVVSSLDRICCRALSLRPSDRYPTALDLADDLEPCLSELGSPVSRREIGATVAKLFEDVRARTREAIERKLGRTSLTRPAVAAADSGEVPAIASDPALPTSAPSTARRPRRLIVLAAAGATFTVLLLLGAWRSGIFARGDSPPLELSPMVRSPPPASSATPTPRAPVAPPTPDQRLVGHDVPQTAGRTAKGMDAAPQPAARPAAHPAVTRRKSRDLAASSTAKRQERVMAPPPAATASPPPPPNDCDRPFFVDADGIKKFRPECM